MTEVSTTEEEYEVQNFTEEYEIVVSDSPTTILTEPVEVEVVVEEDDVVIETIVGESAIIESVGIGPQGPAGTGAQEVFYSSSDPGATGTPYLWIQDVGGGDFTIWVDDGSGS